MSGDFSLPQKAWLWIYRYIDICHYRIKKDGKHTVVKNI